jgi:hypothetical protein
MERQKNECTTCGRFMSICRISKGGDNLFVFVGGVSPIVDECFAPLAINHPKQYSALPQSFSNSNPQVQHFSDSGPLNVLNLCVYVHHLNQQNTPNLSAVLKDRYSTPYLLLPLSRGGWALYARI